MNESATWHDLYDAEPQVRRRRQALPEKLRKLGATACNEDDRILDLCCGNGETLDALHQFGLRNLQGIDIFIPAELGADLRFKACLGDAAALPLTTNSKDWIFIIHALHHLGPPERIEEVLTECYRVLKPGGRLALIDFPNSIQIRAAFWFFRQNIWLITPYLRYFGKLIQEEWVFLREYLPQWRRVEALLLHGIFEVELHQKELFYYYIRLRKPPI